MALLFIVVAIASIVFGIYEFTKGEVTNGLLDFILSLLALILTVLA